MSPFTVGTLSRASSYWHATSCRSVSSCHSKKILDICRRITSTWIGCATLDGNSVNFTYTYSNDTYCTLYYSLSLTLSLDYRRLPNHYTLHLNSYCNEQWQYALSHSALLNGFSQSFCDMHKLNGLSHRYNVCVSHNERLFSISIQEDSHQNHDVFPSNTSIFRRINKIFR